MFAGLYLPDLLAEGNMSSLGDHEPRPLGPPATEGTPSAVLSLPSLHLAERCGGVPLHRPPSPRGYVATTGAGRARSSVARARRQAMTARPVRTAPATRNPASQVHGLSPNRPG